MSLRILGLFILLSFLTVGIGRTASDTPPGAQTAKSGKPDKAVSDLSNCSWPMNPTTYNGPCNTCAVACRKPQVASCAPGIVPPGSSICARQPDCTCR